MTTKRQNPTISWDRLDGMMSAARAERTEYLASCIAAACLAFRRPVMRSTTIVALAGGETHAHCLRLAQGLLPPEGFESHAQRLAFLRSATEADLGRASRKAWTAGAGRAFRACVQLVKRQAGAALSGNMSTGQVGRRSAGA